MKEFIYFITFVSLAGFCISNEVYETKLVELQENPRLLGNDAVIDDTLSQKFKNVPEEVRISTVWQMYEATGRALKAEELTPSSDLQKYSVKFVDKPLTPRKNVYLVPLGNPTQVWVTFQSHDKNTCTSTWYAFWV